MASEAMGNENDSEWTNIEKNFIHGSEKLDLSNSNIKHFPQNLLNMSNLQFLYLGMNELKEIPEDFSKQLVHLKWLDLRNNYLTSIPCNIFLLKNLKNLLLEGNLLVKLPSELGLLSSLSGLNLASNPLEFPPKHVVESGTKAILKFLRDNLKPETNTEDNVSPPTDSKKDEENTFRLEEDGVQTFEDSKVNVVIKEELYLIEVHNDYSFAVDPNNLNLTTSPLSQTSQSSQDEPTTSKETDIKPKPNHSVLEPKLKANRRISSRSNSQKSSNLGNADIILKYSVKINQSGNPNILGFPEQNRILNPERKDKNTAKRVERSKAIKITENRKPANAGGLLNTSKHFPPKQIGDISSKKEQILNIFRSTDENIRSLTSPSSTPTISIRKQHLTSTSNLTNQVKFTINKITNKQKNTMKTPTVNLGTLEVGQMVAMKVDSDHFIPGQPCIGKVTKLPNQNGDITIHYFTGKYEGKFWPMMSRQSPYLREVSTENIFHTFHLDAESKIKEKDKEIIKSNSNPWKKK